MYSFKFVMKDGTVVIAKSKFIDLSTVHSMLNDHQPFIQIADTVFAKDAISYIQKLNTLED